MKAAAEFLRTTGARRENGGEPSPEDADDDTVRQMMLSAVQVILEGKQCLKAKGSTKAGSTRAGFLRALVEIIGPPPEDRTWRDEWVDINQKTAALRGWPVPTEEQLTGDGKFSLEKKLQNYSFQVEYKLRLGWDREDAEAHVALSGVAATAISDGIRQGDPR